MDIVTLASYIVVGFFVITIIGVLVGGKTFGEVIGGGILSILFVVAILIGFGVYKQEQEKEQREEERNEQREEKKKKQELILTLSKEDKKSTDNTFINFHNDCSKRVTLKLYYLNKSGDWRIGSWDMDSNMENLLADSHSERIESDNAALFYEVKGRAGDYVSFDGDFDFEKYGESYSMKKVYDDYDATYFRYTCK